LLASKVTFDSAGVLKISAFEPFDGAKNVTLTAVANATGKTSAVTFTVYGRSVANTPSLIAPASNPGEGETGFKVELKIVDNFGNEMTADKILELTNSPAKITIISSNSSVFTATTLVKSDNKAYVAITPIAKGTANLTVTVNATGLSTTLPITVVDAKYPASITLSPDYTYAVSGGAIKVKATFLDQYGSAMKASTAVVQVVEDNTFFGDVANSTVTDMFNDGVEFTATAWDKVTKVTFNLMNGAQVVDTASVTLTSVKQDATLTYEVTPMTTMAAKSFNTAAYEKEVKINAVDASGNKVALTGTEIQSVVSADAKLVVTTASPITLKANALDVDGEFAFTVVANTNSGIKVMTSKVVISKVAPIAQSIVAEDKDEKVITKIDLTTADYLDEEVFFVIKDQYATEAMAPAAVYVVNSNTGVVVLTGAALTHTNLPVGTYKITAITSNGLSAVVEVTVVAAS
jgi:hypothetical protein